MALVVVRLLLTSPLSRPVEYGVYLGGVNNAAATYLDGLAFTLDNFSSDYFGESTMSGSRSRVKRIKSIVRDILIFYRRVTVSFLLLLCMLLVLRSHFLSNKQTFILSSAQTVLRAR